MRDRQDIEPDYIYRCIINQQQYFDKYPDVQQSGMLAADHYFTYGVNESRELKRPGLLKHPQAFRIDHQATLFLSSAPRRDGSFVYRCLFQSKS